MIELLNTTQQTIAVGDSVVFDKKVIQTGCCECHRNNTPAVKMNQRGYYEVTFNGNISSDRFAVRRSNPSGDDNDFGSGSG